LNAASPNPDVNESSAWLIAKAVKAGRTSARSVVACALQQIARDNPSLNAFTAVLADQALADAEAIDAALAAGRPTGPLAGVPFAVKNLFDVAGVITLAGSKIRRDAPPASRDADLVARLKAAGAILVGTLNMDEFAYGFVTENAHYGVTRNPHDLERIAGGSSGGSAAAVAAGLVPFTLGSDTNGSVRVPAALCGVYGLKPSWGRLSLAGVFPFVESLDHAGLFARTLEDLAIVYAAALSDGDAALADPIFSRLDELAGKRLRVGMLGGWFTQGAAAEVLEALEPLGDALNADVDVTFEGAEAARSAAFCLSAYEGARLHLDDLRRQASAFDPAVRDRLLAGALLPDHTAAQANTYRRIFRNAARQLFTRYDVLIAATTPCVAPRIGEPTMMVDGEAVSVRKNLGAYTQPLSFIGLPVLAAPLNRPGRLPIGVQIVADHGREDLAFALAAKLECLGLIQAHRPDQRAIRTHIGRIFQ
jgi:aspartyl-tRNA(Asn)/glutamyl-tRNA(Gln) amidotransferase subunit A